ncbi:hypothetical protein J416_02871 [Gracilibacillus halophilus YIM-C55.5]|uniref:SpoOB alpha-helical domain-containing protein n=1 Tax=Gracilibacillus halophilus YIM-C55.5 TaxID=1308866 RepID=N4WPB2_9BACI|nr:Spo0B domain-containing protein [Gracilibacillus halophilus]ENH97962.1 hypothetical protein J416_02871 [Gracilibacillus halophilus YIM-C55.5]
MNEEEIVEIIRHYRHDWLNELQLIMGYAQMGKLERVQEKTQDILAMTNHERALDQLGLPKTLITILQQQWRTDEISLTYQVNREQQNVEASDEQVEKHLSQLLQQLRQMATTTNPMNVELMLNADTDQLVIQAVISPSQAYNKQEIKYIQNLSFIQKITTEDSVIHIEWIE